VYPVSRQTIQGGESCASGEFYFRGARAFPSYLQAGPSFFIEKSKRQMIAEDIAAALAVAQIPGLALERG
jgi:hypothetical protein